MWQGGLGRVDAYDWSPQRERKGKGEGGFGGQDWGSVRDMAGNVQQVEVE